MKGLTLTQREQGRLEILNRVLEHRLDVSHASRILGVSERHMWRILAAYREEGAAALAHGNRGRRPVNALDPEVVSIVVELARTRYQGCNHTHLTELLAEREGISLSRSTVRSVLTRAGVPSPRRRRPPRHRVRRERLPQEGMLLQIDGSDHDWLQGRGPRLTLVLAVDDATSTAPYALFRKEEDSLGYFLLLQGIIERRGIPLALYSDRHTAFRQAQAPLGGPFSGPTQFGRAMQELGVTQVFAQSPEAKGRVERANGTFQDRLVAELRLAGASTMEEANRVLWEFLPRVNERFGVPAGHSGSAYRRPDGLNVEDILCFKYRRKVARDNTVKFRWRTLQLLPSHKRPTYAGLQVEVQVHLDGRLVVAHEGHAVASQEAPPRPAVLRDRAQTNAMEQSLASGVIPVSGDQGRGEGLRGGASEGVAAGSRFLSMGARRGVRRRGTAFRGLEVVASGRHPTPRQQARWEAVQAALREGLNLTAIARQVGIDRKTARRYAAALLRAPMNPPRKPLRDPADDGWAGHELIDRELEGTKADELAELLRVVR
jgi:transposase